MTCWIAGAPGEARSAFALELAARLRRRVLAVELLDEPGARRLHALDDAPDLEAIAYLGELLMRHGVVAIVAESALSEPRRRSICERLGRTIVVHIDGPALANPPTTADHRFRVGRDGLTDSVKLLVDLLEHRSLIPSTSSDVDRDEALVVARLSDLGYL
ncbi:MAG: hypothetical protein KIT31_14315 [Deltaproteobacteria bacterium]|nr:hypothetical protein [Deltaproteobacteria bacterium]